jgi:protocatechuate 3,4-dioxygenase beta subunit
VRPLGRLVLVAASVLVGACTGDESGRSATTPETTIRVATTSSSASPAGTAPCPASVPGQGADGEATVTLGPAAGLPPTSSPGEPLVIGGTVYDGTCRPLAGVTLSVWQTDGAGIYGPGQGTDSIECCYLQGSVTTDREGRYQLVTSMPGHYHGEATPPPAHIHVEARHPTAGVLVTEIVFAGDPYLTPVRGDDRLVVTLADDPGTGQHGVADLVFR